MQHLIKKNYLPHNDEINSIKYLTPYDVNVKWDVLSFV